MTVRRLLVEEIGRQLRAGRAIEQWLGHTEENGYNVIRFIRVEREGPDKYCVAFFEHFDDGDKDFLDVYSFSSLDPDLPSGLTSFFSTVEDAIRHAQKKYGANEREFVCSGLIQDFYAEYLKSP